MGEGRCIPVDGIIGHMGCGAGAGLSKADFSEPSRFRDGHGTRDALSRLLVLVVEVIQHTAFAVGIGGEHVQADGMEIRLAKDRVFVVHLESVHIHGALKGEAKIDRVFPGVDVHFAQSPWVQQMIGDAGVEVGPLAGSQQDGGFDHGDVSRCYKNNIGSELILGFRVDAHQSGVCRQFVPAQEGGRILRPARNWQGHAAKEDEDDDTAMAKAGVHGMMLRQYSRPLKL